MLIWVLVASVAQLVEQLTLNQLVLGSSPSRGTTSDLLKWPAFLWKPRTVDLNATCLPGRMTNDQFPTTQSGLGCDLRCSGA
jgi:hypothetical protein